MIIKTLFGMIECDYDSNFYKMVHSLSRSLNVTTVQCTIMDVDGKYVFYKDDIFYSKEWEEWEEKESQKELLLYIRPMFEIQTVKNNHLYTFLSEYDQEMNKTNDMKWEKNTIVWFDVVGNRIYSVRYTGYNEITEMFSIQIDKFISELDGNECEEFYKDNITSIAKERFQYIKEGRVV